MTANDKDTIYIDIDDEITGIIDKLKSSNGKIVALVLPKRASVFQSIVNMKLLKRAADEAKKHLVLITSEAGLLPLAGLAGVHVAKTLTSKPEVPAGPMLDSDAEETIQEGGETIDELPPDAAEQPIGKLAGIGAAATGADGVETLTLDDDEAPEALADAAAATKTFEPPKGKKNKKLSVPNFEKFRLLLVLGVLAGILLIGGGVYAAVALPKATINIKTDASNVDTNLNLNLSTAAKTLKASTSTVPAKLATQQKSNTQQVTTTGQKNNGNKASGRLAMSALICGSIPDNGPPDVPAGTGVSSNGLTYIAQENTSFSPIPSGPPKNKCYSYNATDSTTIIAQNGGSSYNGANSFAVAGRKDVSASVSSSISGGTDNITQVVSATDIANVKAKLTAADANLKVPLETELKQQGYRAISATYLAGTPAVTVSAQPGDAASTVTATSTVTYTMFGVHDSDLKKLVEDSIKKEIDTNKQSILDNGLSGAAFTVTNQSATDAQVTLAATATAGPDLDVATIKSDAAGKKGADIRASLQNNPDVKSVDVKLSPFWVNSVPKKTDKIIVNIAKPTSTKPSTSNGSNP
ncbi:MAG: hypothetical protein JWO35_282 [Candidatus Saccharibacteria bacterium]|nr:hypothetical protein [Candidatus Saccharibacteria bacterium]